MHKFVIRVSAFIFVPRTKVEGMSNLPQKGGFIIAINHISVLDPLVIVGVMKNFLWKHYISKGKKIYGIGNERLKEKWIYALFFGEDFGLIPSTKEGIHRAVELLKQGNIVEIFPEGGVNPKDYLIRGRNGVAYMAILSGVPVIPGASITTPAINASQGRKTLLKTRKLIFGEPMNFLKRQRSYFNFNRTTVSTAIDKIMREIAKLAGKKYKPHLRLKRTKRT